MFIIFIFIIIVIVVVFTFSAQWQTETEKTRAPDTFWLDELFSLIMWSIIAAVEMNAAVGCAPQLPPGPWPWGSTYQLTWWWSSPPRSMSVAPAKSTVRRICCRWLAEQDDRK